MEDCSLQNVFELVVVSSRPGFNRLVAFAQAFLSRTAVF
jgi:hypothetical protein